VVIVGLIGVALGIAVGVPVIDVLGIAVGIAVGISVGDLVGLAVVVAVGLDVVGDLDVGGIVVGLVDVGFFVIATVGFLVTGVGVHCGPTLSAKLKNGHHKLFAAIREKSHDSA